MHIHLDSTMTSWKNRFMDPVDVTPAFDDFGGWPHVFSEIASGHDLSRELSDVVGQEVLNGRATDAQIAALIFGLRVKGESASELTGFVDAMLREASPLTLPDPEGTVDIVGVGGSTALRGRAFNVSTVAAIVTAGAGVSVCKHGNRKASSTSGSTDVLEALGVQVELNGSGVEACLREANIGFAFARMFHPAMRFVVGVRGELGVPTLFNLLGPLSHPGRVRRQVIGVPDPRHVDLVAGVLRERKMSHALVVNGEDGLDEISTTTTSRIVEIIDGEIVSDKLVHPGNFGLPTATLDQLGVGGPQDNASVARSILAGEPGAFRDIVALNAAAAIYVSGHADSLEAGLEQADQSINDGAALNTLSKLIAISTEVA